MRKSTVRHALRRGTAESGGKNRSSGFTLLETLLTVAILVILLGLSMVGVARYKDHLKITELDNAARDIYMAAQNRAVLLRNSGRLKTELGGTAVKKLTNLSYVTVDGGSSNLSTDGTDYITWREVSSCNWDEVLPVGTIDSALRNGKFHIVYEPDSGSVTDVFYSEANTIAKIDIAFELADQGRYARMRPGKYKAEYKDIPMVGWYGGDASEEIDTHPLPAPGVEVLITNDNQLTATVTYTLPDGVTTTNESGKIRIAPTYTLKLEYPAGSGTWYDAGSYVPSLTFDAVTKTAAYTWVLDSLESGKQFKDLKFKNSLDLDMLCPFDSNNLLGDNFTISAGLTLKAVDSEGNPVPGYIDGAYYATDTDNSLFAEDSTYNTTDGTALIANLRHLQNLHAAYSKAGEGAVKAKQQLCDIDCEKSMRNDGTAIDEHYKFIPIENPKLTSYDGQGKLITSLYTQRNVNNAGLFGEVSNILEIKNCRVCWKDPKKLVTQETNPTDFVYAVSGKHAGGLVGCVSGSVSIKNSFAATTVEGTSTSILDTIPSAAGGLVGVVSGGAVTVNNSYADCYLRGKKNIGGLVGSGSVNELKNSYAAGFIINPADTANTAGLVNGSVTSAENVYSVVRVQTVTTVGGTISLKKMTKPATPLYGALKNGDGDVRYLFKANSVKGSPFGSWFEHDEDKTETNIYNLRYEISNPKDNELNLEGMDYPYPVVKQAILNDAGEIAYGDVLPHYGDWAELENAVPMGLVYYEQYSDGKYSVSGQYEDRSLAQNLKHDTESLKHDTESLKHDTESLVVRKDGYALVLDGTDLPVLEYAINYGVPELDEDGNLKLNGDGTVAGIQTWALTVEETDPDPKTGAKRYTGKWTYPKKDQDGKLLPNAKNPTLVKDESSSSIKSFTITHEDKTYTLFALPDAVVTGAPADTEKFFQKLDTVTEEEAKNRTFYFNPHFAGKMEKKAANEEPVLVPVVAGKAVVTPETDTKPETTTYTPPAVPAEPAHSENSAIVVRTARHFYNLSAFQHTDSDYAPKKLYFVQQLDIDYGAYTGYPGIFEPGNPKKKSELPFRQNPIGEGTNPSNITPFLGTYDGGCHTIQNVFFNATKSYLGIFGLVGQGWPDTTLKNIVYVMDPEKRLDANNGNTNIAFAIGTLVGKNYGTIDNCSVSGVNMIGRSRYVGGLVGYNSQVLITNCSAELVHLTANLQHVDPIELVPHAGGLVGSQLGSLKEGGTGTIRNSYAVGKLENSVQSDSAVIIGGLVGPSGNIVNSYAAVNLLGPGEKYGLGGGDGGTSGTAAEQGVVGDKGKPDDNSGWLEGVFEYRGERYTNVAGGYEDGGKNGKVSKGITIKELKDRLGVGTGTTPKPDPILSAVTKNTIKNIPSSIPSNVEDYTDLYRDKADDYKDFPYLTGVKTTLKRTVAGHNGSGDIYAITGAYAAETPVHYGLWPVPVLTAGLAYYEDYAIRTADGGFIRDKNNNIVLSEQRPKGVLGQYEKQEINFPGSALREAAENYAVVKDGYALVFEMGSAPIHITYDQEWTLKGSTWTRDSDSTKTKIEVTPFTVSRGAETYTLVPLPEAVITGEPKDKANFYQELEIKTGVPTLERTFYFNPHFASSVKPGTFNAAGAYTKPPRPDNPTYKTSAAIVRTARHLYDLSVFQSTYAPKVIYFRQDLNLDYSDYAVGYTGSLPGSIRYTGTGSFKQEPIGAMDQPDKYFAGTYDGDCHTIENVFFRPAEGQDLAGLFGSTGANSGSFGNLKNIVYKLDPGKTEYASDKFYRAAGALVGKNYGTAQNCAVYGVNMNVTGKFVGGLAGYNQGIVTNCAAELSQLTIMEIVGFEAAGGLVGAQGKETINSYAVGKITNQNSGGNTSGLVGKGGKVNTSYAAVNLDGGGTRYGLCPGTDENVTSSGWLKDAFIYRGEKYNTVLINEYGDFDRAISFQEMKTRLTPTLSNATTTVLNIPDTEEGNKYRPAYEGKRFPYLTGVKTKDLTDPTGEPIHYGLWPTSLPVGLTYYEEYGARAENGELSRDENNRIVISERVALGQYENQPIDSSPLKADTDNPVVGKDGYALVFEGTDVPEGGYVVTYGDGAGKQIWTLTLTKTADNDNIWKWDEETENVTPITSIDGYTIIPLPDEVVTGNLADRNHFYQKLVYGEGMYSQRDFYFNPYFAKTVRVEKDVDGNVVRPKEPDLVRGDYEDSKEFIAGDPAISVRTPRHFFNLSAYGPKLSGRHYYLQELDIDYSTYAWYGTQPTETTSNNFYNQGPGHYYVQAPICLFDTNNIGTKYAFTYDGGCHQISNVVVDGTTQQVNNDSDTVKEAVYSGLFAGVFWYGDRATGACCVLKNVVYKMDPEANRYMLTLKRSQEAINRDRTSIFGVLVGSNGGVVRNCAVYDVNMEVHSCSYVGGLVGAGRGTVRNCSAELADLEGDVGAGGHIGGLVGWLRNNTNDHTGGRVFSSYAVGKLTALYNEGTVCGLAGDAWPYSEVHDCYAAVYLAGNDKPDQDKYVYKYGLFPPVYTNAEGAKSDINPDNSYWLQGKFRYRGGNWPEYNTSTDYTDKFDYTDKDGNSRPAWSITPAQLAEKLPMLSPVENTVKYFPAGNDYSSYYTGNFPYRSGVTTVFTRVANGKITGVLQQPVPVHYGLWPVDITPRIATASLTEDEAAAEAESAAEAEAATEAEAESAAETASASMTKNVSSPMDAIDAAPAPEPVTGPEPVEANPESEDESEPTD